MIILKRDGRSVNFDPQKISNAIAKAAAASGENLEPIDIQYITHKVVSQLQDPCTVEQVQDRVEDTLIRYDYEKTAKAYILYRAQRAKLRDADSELMAIFNELTYADAKDSDMKRENANVDGDTSMGTMLKYGSESAKYYIDKYILPPHIAKAHLAGDIHIHDKDFYLLTETCISENSPLIVKINNEIMLLKAKELEKQFPELVDVDNIVHVKNSSLEVLSNGRFVEVKNIVSHNPDNKRMLRIKTRTGEIEVTEDHRVSVKRDNELLDIHAKDLTVDDILVFDSFLPERFSLQTIDLIELFKTNNNIIIANSKDVIENIKERGLKKELNDIFPYSDARLANVRDGCNKMTVPEFLMIEHLTSLSRNELKLSYKRTRHPERINAILPLTKELGKFIGLMYSDGSVTSYYSPMHDSIEKKACFTNYDEALIKEFNRCAATIFNNVRLRNRYSEGELSGSILSGYLAYELFRGPFGKKKSELDISLPRWIYVANKDFLSGFLGGLIDGDGTVQKDGYRVRIASSICLPFLQQLQTLLNFRGIPSSIKQQNSSKRGSLAYFNNNGQIVTSVRNGSSYILDITGKLEERLGWIDSFKIKDTELSNADKMPFKYFKIQGIEVVNSYDGKVYDLETEDHHFDVNGFMVHNCCQIDPIKLFANGFSTGHGFLREPQSIQSYASLACIAIQANQNEMHGGQSIPNFDYAMAPGVDKSFKKNFKAALLEALLIEGLNEAEATERLGSINCPSLSTYKEWKTTEDVINKHAKLAGELAYKKTDKDTYQAMEALVHNLNTMHSRAGAQVPFSSLNFGTDTSPEGRMVIKNLLLATEAGLGNGETAIFPVSIFKVKEGVNFNEGDPNYDLFKLAIRVSAKRLFPNFSFLDAPFNKTFYKEGDYNTEVAYMGCRTRVMANHHDPSKAVVCGRGNLSFTSINLPRLGIEAHGDFNKFYEMLDEKLELVAEQLLHRLKIQSKKKVKNYPFLMGQGIWIDSDNLGPDDEVGEVLKEGTLSIGFIGLAETMVALTGKHHGEDETARKQAYEIVKHIREFCDKKSEETGLNFTTLATPAEGLSGRFVKIDQKKYGKIPGVTDRDYYTNSFHVPVYYPISAFEKLDIEAPYHELTNAGHISYVELDGDTAKNPEAFEAIIRHMKEVGIGYGSVNHPVDRDPVCGYVGTIDDICPRCGRRENEPVSIERLNELRKRFPDIPVPCDCTH